MAEHNAGYPYRPPAPTTPAERTASPNGDTEGATPAPAPTRAPVKPRPTTSAPPAEPKDSFREVVETVVFVVVLVLLLKSFVAEAFVIPTGSMAETLYGYQKIVVCPKCGFEFPVNCSNEVDPQQADSRAPVVGATCPNCRYHVDIPKETSWSTGDRVLVAKYLYDLGLFHLDHPNRQDVVVFKYPEKPQRDWTPMNYIKRLVGLPGETIAIFYGKLYRRDDIHYDDGDINKLDLWRPEHTHRDEAVDDFLKDERAPAAGRRFTIIRKPPGKILAERRIVFDNDHQAKDLVGKLPSRWRGDGWAPDNAEEPHTFRRAAGDERLSWLRYHHVFPNPDNRSGDARDRLITDFMGYNSWEPPRDHFRWHTSPPENWVGDLMLECQVTIDEPRGELVLELSKGVDRFRAKFDLASGSCTLSRLTADREVELERKDTSLRGAGKFNLRFANVDERLTVWVDGKLPFGDGVAYDAPVERGPQRNDLEPVSVGIRGGGASVAQLKVWRDTYYTTNVGNDNVPDSGVVVDLSDPQAWRPLREDVKPRTFYVQPGHFLCMGDNSPESSDGRSWGLVPQRLMLGRALLIYFPFGRAGRIQ